MKKTLESTKVLQHISSPSPSPSSSSSSSAALKPHLSSGNHRPSLARIAMAALALAGGAGGNQDGSPVAQHPGQGSVPLSLLSAAAAQMSSRCVFTSRSGRGTTTSNLGRRRAGERD
jgi:hypothetical protein